MVKYQRLLRNSRAFRLFLGDMKRSLNHCYLLESPDEAALLELVRLMSCALHCESAGEIPCLKCPGCKRYESLTGGNIFVYPREERIKKDDVEDLLRNINYKAFEHGKKIVVLRRADRMDSGTQNKLLKTLEEPPENVIFFLLAENANKLLPTVRSRSKLLELEKFPDSEILAELGETGGAADEAVAAAGGCVGIAERNLKDPTFAKVSSFAEGLLARISRTAFAEYSARFDEIKPEYESFLDFLQILLRDALVRSEGLTGLEMLKTSRRLPGVRAERIADAISFVNGCKRKIVSNCNAQAAYDMLLVELIHMKTEVQ